MIKVTHDVPIIVTGLSGAGISSALKALEDFRFEVFDNFPIAMIPDLYDASHTDNIGNNLAIGVDTRTRGFSPQGVMRVAKEMNAQILFITCDDAVLYKRFAETRRRHPMAQTETVARGIAQERALLQPLLDHADIVIDSSDRSIHDLRHVLEGHFVQQPQDNMNITLMSFGFKNGSPREADIVMDVRFLKNPHWEESLRAKTGKDDAVGAYIREDTAFVGFLDGFKAMLTPLLPRFAYEGKSYLTIAIGCTGGKHRSVYTVELLQSWMREQGLNVGVEHRDMPV